MQPVFDVFIFGQGLAGSLLAWHLKQKGKKVLLIDDKHQSSSSIVAAGIINPLAGLRFSVPPEIHKWLSYAEQCYEELSQYFKVDLYHPVEMLRIFRTLEQRHYWQQRTKEEDAAYLLGSSFPADETPEPVDAPLGGFLQRHTGYIEVKELLLQLAGHFDHDSAYLHKSFSYEEIRVRKGTVEFGGYRATKAVFCEGYRALENPWFKYLPIQTDKGEILTLSTSADMPGRIINGAHWLVPLVDGRYRFGATHDHHTRDSKPTSAGKASLLQALSELVTHNVVPSIDTHLAGVRPGTMDRYPLIGRHPQEERVFIFNGFGARGSLMIPWYAKQVAGVLSGEQDIPVEADIRRYA